MTQEEAVQMLKNSVLARGGNIDKFSFSVHTQTLDLFIGNERVVKTETRFYVQHMGSGAIVADADRMSIVDAVLDKFFSVPEEGVTCEVVESPEDAKEEYPF